MINFFYFDVTIIIDTNIFVGLFLSIFIKLESKSLIFDHVTKKVKRSIFNINLLSISDFYVQQSRIQKIVVSVYFLFKYQ